MLLLSLTIFTLAVFVGFEIINKVPPTLHTPLMSGSNAISGIAVVGAILAAEVAQGWFANTLAFVAVVLAMINVMGGFMVTHRMLAMFKSKPKAGEQKVEPMHMPIGVQVADPALIEQAIDRAIAQQTGGPSFVQAAYLLSAILFILGLKGLTRPRTAVRGNQLGALGMAVAVIAVLLAAKVHVGLILAGVAVGGAIGAVMAGRVKMTDMPQLVALFNGFGGGASALVPAALVATAGTMGADAAASLAGGLSAFIGAVTLTGSSIAFAKLQGLKWGDVRVPSQMALNAVLSAVAAALLIYLAVSPDATFGFWLLIVLSLVLGVTFVSPIGGADMPVVIALLNSLSGLAAAAAGFTLVPQNNALIVSGSLVGASGLILTGIMCKAMNRSLFDVLFKQFGGTSSAKGDDVYAGKIKSTTADELAMLLETASRVVFVPGYGMAVSQAQHAVRELTNAMEKNGTEVLFGIHPVAGRMPGHMNVLLAEADIDYAKLLDLDAVNSMFKQTDVAIVIGANDVVNPVARDDQSSPIYGMPILDVDQARTVIVVKRSSPGFAGIPNPLFAAENTLMFFEDAKKSMADTAAALKGA